MYHGNESGIDGMTVGPFFITPQKVTPLKKYLKQIRYMVF